LLEKLINHVTLTNILNVTRTKYSTRKMTHKPHETFKYFNSNYL